MKKTVKAILMISAIYVLPLVGAPELILNLKIAVLMAACAIMLLTQPEFSVDDAKENHGSDRWSVLAILAAGGISQIVPVVEWGYFRDPAAQGGTVGTAVGLTLIILGLAFRIWSIRTLGKFFTATVQITEGHRVVKSGPYAIVRHPSYLGAYAAIVGSALFLNAIIGTAIAALAMFVVYRKRIAAEEATLINEFGEEYRDYRHATPAIVPFVGHGQGGIS